MQGRLPGLQRSERTPAEPLPYNAAERSRATLGSFLLCFQVHEDSLRRNWWRGTGTPLSSAASQGPARAVSQGCNRSGWSQLADEPRRKLRIATPASECAGSQPPDGFRQSVLNI